MGLKQAAVVSDGRRLENQKPLARHLKKLGRLQRTLSRKQKVKNPETGKTTFSKNYEKQRVKVAQKHQQIAPIRADSAMGQLLTFLKNKIASAGGQIFQASRWFPSTKRCSGCGLVKKRMPLKHRTYQCLGCGLVIDRDLNASLNLAQFAHDLLRHLPA